METSNVSSFTNSWLRRITLAVIAAGVFLAGQPGWAANIYKRNTANMNTTDDWSTSSASGGATGGVPSSANIGYFGSSYNMGTRTNFDLGGTADVSLKGLYFDASKAITINPSVAGQAIIIGSSGIRYNNASFAGVLTVNSKIKVSAGQNWYPFNGKGNLTITNADLTYGVNCDGSYMGGTLMLNGAVNVSSNYFWAQNFDAISGGGSMGTTGTGKLRIDSPVGTTGGSVPLTLGNAGDKTDTTWHYSAGVYFGNTWEHEYFGDITLGVDPIIIASEGSLALHNISGTGGIDYWYGGGLILKGTCTYEGVTLIEAQSSVSDISGADMTGCNTAISIADTANSGISLKPATATYMIGNAATASKGASLNLGADLDVYYQPNQLVMNDGVATTVTLRQGSDFASDGLVLGNNNLLWLDLAGTSGGSQGVDNLAVGGASATASASGDVYVLFDLSAVATNGAGARILNQTTNTVISAPNGDLTAGGANWIVGVGNYDGGYAISTPASTEYIVNRSTFPELSLDKDYKLTLTVTTTNVTLAIAEAVAEVPIDHYDVEPSSYSVTAGTPFSLTVTAKNADETVVSNATTSVSLAAVDKGWPDFVGNFLFDGDGDGTYDKSTKNLVSGTFTINAKGTRVGEGPWQMRASDGFGKSGLSGAITVNPAPASKLVFVQPPFNNPVPAPTADGFDVILQTFDEYDNLANVVSNTLVTLSTATGTTNLIGTTNGTITAGTHEVTIAGVVYPKAETNVSIMVSSTSGDTLSAATSELFRVSAGALAQLIVTKEPEGPFQAGYANVQSKQPIIQVKDQYGNMTGAGKVVYVSYTPGHYIGDVREYVSRGFHSVDTNGVADFSNTKGSWSWVTPPTNAQTGLRFSYTVDSVTYDDPTEFTVNAGAPVYLWFKSVNGGLNPTAGVGFPVVLWAIDNFYNPAALSGNRSVTLSRAAGTGALGGTTSGTMLAGTNVLTFSNVTYSVGETGVQFIANNTGSAPWPMASAPFTVNRAINHFHVTAGSPQEQSRAFTVTVTAHDASHNTITEDNQTVVTMTSSGATVFDSNGNGTYGDNTKALTGGTMTITAKDEVTQLMTMTATGGGATGTSSPITVYARGTLLIIK
jgi:hypothetical protein